MLRKTIALGTCALAAGATATAVKSATSSASLSTKGAAPVGNSPPRRMLSVAASSSDDDGSRAKHTGRGQPDLRKFKKAIVVGGGVVGVTTAAELANRGIEVTLVEAGSGVANECSRAAAGGMQKSNPVIDQEKWFATVKSWLLSMFPFRSEQSPLPAVFISPKVMIDRHFLRWFWSFTKHSLFCSEKDQTYQREQMLAFTDWAIESAVSLMKSDGGHLAQAAALKTTGAIKLLYNESDFDATKHKIFNGTEEWRFVKREELTSVEPSLKSFVSPTGSPPVGAILQPTAAHAHCSWFTRAFHEKTKDRMTVLYNTRIERLHPGDDGSSIASITTTDGKTIDVDSDTVVVLAAGSWTPNISRTVNRFVPVYPMKGYTLLADTCEADDKQAVPTRVLIEPSSNLFFTSYGPQLRVAAVGEFAGLDTTPSKRISKMLLKRVQASFPALANAFADAKVVCGLRPFTADGAVIIGRDDKFGNLAYNVGPGLNGWKVAIGSARFLAAVLDADKDYISELPFDPMVLDPAGRVVDL